MQSHICYESTHHFFAGVVFIRSKKEGLGTYL